MKKLLIIPIIFVALIQLVSAFTFINIFVDQAGNSIFLGETDEVLSLPTGITLNDNEIAGLSSTLTTKEGEIWAFSYTLEGAELTVKLPKGARIQDTNAQEIFIDNNQISVYGLNRIDIKYSIATSSNIRPPINIPLIAILLAILIILIVFLINYTKREKKEVIKEKKNRVRKRQDLEIIRQVLNVRERTIVDKLRETGIIKSSQLRKILDIPKASFSRHIQELEKKKLIRRTGEGRNKSVILLKK